MSSMSSSSSFFAGSLSYNSCTHTRIHTHTHTRAQVTSNAAGTWTWTHTPADTHKQTCTHRPWLLDVCVCVCVCVRTLGNTMWQVEHANSPPHAPAQHTHTHAQTHTFLRHPRVAFFTSSLPAWHARTHARTHTHTHTRTHTHLPALCHSRVPPLTGSCPPLPPHPHARPVCACVCV